MKTVYRLRLSYELIHDIATSLSPEADIYDWSFNDRVYIVVEHFKRCNVMLVDKITVTISSLLEFVDLYITCKSKELNRMKLLYGTPKFNIDTDAFTVDTSVLDLIITKI